jgi:class 3 adenylate cyclase
MAMQGELRHSQLSRGDDRLAMRIVITLGDVLTEEGDLFGDAVALTDRIEAVTPPDEIFLSAAARLAVNQAQVRTAFVDTFTLKGSAEPFQSTGSSRRTTPRSSRVNTSSSPISAATQSLSPRQR